MRADFVPVVVTLFTLAAGVIQIAPSDPGAYRTIAEKEPQPQNVPQDEVPKAESQGHRNNSSNSESLSEKLNKGKGVIKPEKGVDPGIVKQAPVPNPNSTPVIIPRGIPGGQPGPEPK
jgi:hypothetical protein